MKSLLVGVLCCLCVTADARSYKGASPSVITDGTSIGLSVSDDGVFDASIATAPAGRQWMSYSAVNASPMFPLVNTRVVSTGLLYSDDAGATWTDAGVTVNAVTEGVRNGHDISWNSEVSSLIYDATASSGARWKLFWHHYPIIDGVHLPGNGWIGYKEADTPEDLVTATEKKLFAGTLYDPANNTAGGDTDSPVGGAPIIPLASLGLSQCLVGTEPGGLANSTAVYLSYDCLQSAPPPFEPSQIVSEGDLLACAQPCTADDPSAWTLAGVPLTVLDSLYFGRLRLSAEDIFTDGTNTFLLVSPVGVSPVIGAYQGCLMFQFTNLATGAILRNADGRPHVINQVQGTNGSFNGACTFSSSTPATGFIYGQVLTFTPGPIFDFFFSGRR